MNLYERYHSGGILHKRVIENWNFTYRLLIPFIEKSLRNSKRVLDVGCGTGTLDFYLAQKDLSITGIDISRNAIQNAKRNARRLNLDSNTNFLVARFPHNSLSKKFDLVICTEVLEHLPHDKKVIREIYKLLFKGGFVVFSSPSLNAPAYRLGLAKRHDLIAGHIRRYTPESYKNLIMTSKFRIVRLARRQGLFRDLLFMTMFGNFVVRFANKFRFVSDVLSVIDDLFLPLGESDIIVVAKKI